MPNSWFDEISFNRCDPKSAAFAQPLYKVGGTIKLTDDEIKELPLEELLQKVAGYYNIGQKETAKMDYSEISTNIARARSIFNQVDHVVCNGPATVVFFTDKSKIVVKKSENDIYDFEKAIMIAIFYKIAGDKASYKKQMKRIKSATKIQNAKEERKLPKEITVDIDELHCALNDENLICKKALAHVMAILNCYIESCYIYLKNEGLVEIKGIKWGNTGVPIDENEVNTDNVEWHLIRTNYNASYFTSRAYANLLKKILKESNMTVKEYAKKCEVSESTLRRILKGQSRPSKEMQTRIFGPKYGA